MTRPGIQRSVPEGLVAAKLVAGTENVTSTLCVLPAAVPVTDAVYVPGVELLHFKDVEASPPAVEIVRLDVIP